MTSHHALAVSAALGAWFGVAHAQPAATPPAPPPACSSTNGLYNELAIGYGASDARTYVGHAEPVSIAVFRGAVGMVLRGCGRGGLEIRAGVVAQGVTPDHTLGGGIGAELEADVPVTPALALGLRVAGGGGTAGWAAAGLRLRHRYLSLGVDGLYSSGVAGRYVDDPQHVTRAPVKGVIGVVGVKLVGPPRYYLIGGGVAAIVIGGLMLYGLSQIST